MHNDEIKTKERPVLPPEYQAIYEEMYKANRQGRGIASFLSQKIESWMHKTVASTQKEGNNVLEIGAGTLNQLQYELNANPIYDIIEPFQKLYIDSSYRKNIRNTYADIDEIPFENISYDRIISIATYEHILNLDEVVAKTTKLLNPGGIHCAAVPNEGYFLWKLGYTMTTGLAFRIKYGLDYNIIMRHEHVNNVNEIEEIFNKHYAKIKRILFGISPSLCLYRVYICTDPIETEECDKG